MTPLALFPNPIVLLALVTWLELLLAPNCTLLDEARVMLLEFPLTVAAAPLVVLMVLLLPERVADALAPKVTASDAAVTVSPVPLRVTAFPVPKWTVLVLPEIVPVLLLPRVTVLPVPLTVSPLPVRVAVLPLAESVN